MPFTLTMPKLSPTMEEGTIVTWHKKEGDQVKEGDILFEVATDKATVEHEALDSGFLRKCLVKEGKEATVNQAVAIFTETLDESIEGYEAEGGIPEEKPSPDESATPEKTSEESPAPVSSSTGSFKQVVFQPEPPLKDYEFEFETEPKSHLAASPLAKKLAKEQGLDLSSTKGTGPNGRVMSRDLKTAQKDTTATFGNLKPCTNLPGSFIEEKLTPMRKAISNRLQASKSFIPHFYTQQDIDIEKIISIRSELKENGIRLTVNDFILRAAALALKEHPVINSGYDSSKDVIVRFQTIDIAVAVSIDEGLITPIVRHVDFKNLGQISSEVKYLAELAKKGELKTDQYKGGSFTISNLGMLGVHDFQPIINPPQAAILGVGGMRECAVIKEGKIAIGKRMMVSLASDHRVIDGIDAAKFLKTFQRYIENPAVLLI